jgi:hypothetical protein
VAALHEMQRHTVKMNSGASGHEGSLAETEPDPFPPIFSPSVGPGAATESPFNESNKSAYPTTCFFDQFPDFAAVSPPPSQMAVK